GTASTRRTSSVPSAGVIRWTIAGIRFRCRSKSRGPACRPRSTRTIRMLRFLTAGESHGKGLLMIIEGVPAGLPLSEDYIAVDLRRRQGGYGRGRRQKIEQDRAEIVSGVRHGL